MKADDSRSSSHSSRPPSPPASLYLFGVEFATGDVYPEYSSLRADPVGARLLSKAWRACPASPPAGISCRSNLRENGATLLMLALDPESFGEDSADSATLESIEQFAGRGNRVVAAMALESESEPGRGRRARASLARPLRPSTPTQARPQLYFAEAADWNVLDRVGPKTAGHRARFRQGQRRPVCRERRLHQRSTVAADRLELVSAALGSDPAHRLRRTPLGDRRIRQHRGAGAPLPPHRAGARARRSARRCSSGEAPPLSAARAPRRARSASPAAPRMPACSRCSAATFRPPNWPPPAGRSGSTPTAAR